MSVFTTQVRLGFAAVVALGLASAASATTFNYNDFSSTAGLQLNGSAAQSGNLLRVTSAGGNQGGSFYRSATLPGDMSFNTNFAININSGGGTDCCGDLPGADGMTFVVHNAPITTGTSTGGSLALNGVTPAVVVEFDTWHQGSFDAPQNTNVNGDHIAIDLAGVPGINWSVAQTAPGATAPGLADGNTRFVWVDYNGASKQFDVFVNTVNAKPANPTVSKNVDLSQVLNSTSVNVGFTGATGGAVENHDVLSWNFNSANASAPGSFKPGVISSADLPAITTNGNATFLADRLRLTAAANSQTGTAFLADPVLMPQNKSFNAEFSFEIGDGNVNQGQGGPDGADGFIFLIHNDVRGASAIGVGGGALGVGGAGDGNRIAPFVGVEFDTWNGGIFADTNHNHIGINTRDESGNDTSLAQTTLGSIPDLNDGTRFNVWVDYDGDTDLFEVFLSTGNIKPGTPTLTTNVDLESLFGPVNDLYVGFAGATGGANERHDIFSFSITNQSFGGIPEPTTGLLGLLALAALGRRRRHAAA